MMLKNINTVVNGRLDSTNNRVGVSASEIPKGQALPAFLANDIDTNYPDRLYSFEILTQPSAGQLYLDKRGVGTFSGAPKGKYSGTERINKYDPGVGLVSSVETTYSFEIAEATPIITSVVINPVTATGSQQFTASVLGENNPPQTVNWTATAGTISNTGTFIAPNATDQVQVVTIRATSTLDQSKFATATVTIAAVIPEVTVSEVTVSPLNVIIVGGTDQQFIHFVYGTNNPPQDVIWETTLGSITASGLLTAPPAALVNQNGMVTVTSAFDPTKQASATFLVPFGQINPDDPDNPDDPFDVQEVKVTPFGLTLAGGVRQQFNSVVVGTGAINQSVSWSISKGTISSTGMATLPAATDVIQTIIVTATSSQDPSISGSVTVYILSNDDPELDTIVIAPNRILRTVAGNYLERDGAKLKGDTFYISQGYWCIEKDIDDILYYALDIEPDLKAMNTDIASVECLTEGVSKVGGPYIKGYLLIAKIAGGNPSTKIDATNLVTFRIICTNGEKFDRSFYVVLKDH